LILNGPDADPSKIIEPSVFELGGEVREMLNAEC